MLVGIFATFLISEPIKRDKEFSYEAKEYFGLLFTFFLSVCAFVACFVFTSDVSGPVKSQLTNIVINKNLAGFVVGVIAIGFGRRGCHISRQIDHENSNCKP